MNLRFYVLASEGGIPKTGLTLTDFSVEVYSVNKSTQAVVHLVNDADMGFEVGDGLYGYFMASPDFSTYDYLVSIQYTGAVSLDYKYWTDNGFDADIVTRSTLGAGGIAWTYTLTEAATGNPIPDADVWVTSDQAGNSILASGKTDGYGKVTFYLDAGTVYVWRQKSGWDFTNPDTEVVS
ncbi:MAG: hypothetical protein HWN68_05940 [Desulfobacterales bacterium]|nr:hypothetical protein [Desulfobacterales bacterium]